MGALVGLLLVAVSAPVRAQLSTQGTLLDHLAGEWVMTGTIQGQPVVHDITAEWVLTGHYLRFYELARERDERGSPAYEAIVFMGWDELTSRFACMWLDITGGGGLNPDGIGYAEPQGDVIPFVFPFDGALIHTTFAYGRDQDRWEWTIDIEREGERESFAEVTLARP